MIVMHRSMTWMTDDGLVVDGGVALVTALEEATSVHAVVCGKPARECFTAAVDIALRHIPRRKEAHV